MQEFNSILAGFGGQGILFMGKAIAYAGLIDGKEVSWLPSYGPEMRGGTANCSVCISEEDICSPLVTNPNVLIAMNLPSFDKFIDTVVPGGTVIIDSTLVSKKVDRTDVNVSYIPATEIAESKGLKGLANIILIGKLLEQTNFCSYETIEKTINEVVPARKKNLIPKNMEAINIGMNYKN
ncbi:MAG: 2-oxoacid:acceptor oxidoreductase family protein [Acutalibacteraceae bacterium]|jgi:2-oxoglutarate ferredoxin oxidoreductase subunit gamma|nr:2-oxoacid:ferredoxin oxidoreductase subunit gamma [Clostridiales bacterium]